MHLSKHILGLECLKCHSQFDFDPRVNLCKSCAHLDARGQEHVDPAILDVKYNYQAAAAALGKFDSSLKEGIFSFLPFLPLVGPGKVLPTGNTALIATPILAHDLGFENLWLKDETRNATRCLKDRATAIFVTMAQELGVKDVYCASAGNAAISLAGYAAHNGINCHVFVPNKVSKTRLQWLQRFGAQIHVSSGNYDQAFAESETMGKDNGWYSRNCAYNPYLVEGKKTVAYEIAAQLDFQVLDIVIAPVGDGCTLAAIGKGFRELREIGMIANVPRLIGVQAEQVNPLVYRFSEANHLPGLANTDLQLTQTCAASIAVHKPRNAIRLFKEMANAGGEIVGVSETEMLEAQNKLSQLGGVVAEITSAATLAGLKKISNKLSGKEKIVLVVTGGRNDEN